MTGGNRNYCSNCGGALSSGERFCGMCGHAVDGKQPLDAEAAVSQPAAAGDQSRAATEGGPGVDAHLADTSSSGADKPGGSRRRWILVGVACAAIAVVAGVTALLVAGSGDSDTGSRPALEASRTNGKPPADTVVRVGAAAVPMATYDHWLRIARGSTPDTNASALKLKNQVLVFLIRVQWLEAEAARRGIEVSEAEAKTSLRKARSKAFPDASDYARFLRRTGQTETDLLYRERSKLLQQKISEDVTAGVPGSSSSVLRRFGREYQRRWRAQTYCRTGYVVEDCSNFSG